MPSSSDNSQPFHLSQPLHQVSPRLTQTVLDRQALRYIIRNTTLAPRVRAEAQLQLTKMHCYTRPTQIHNRCIMGGQGRGVLSDFKMTRVRFSFSDTPGGNWDQTLTSDLQFQFRVNAMAGNLPGVKRASW